MRVWVSITESVLIMNKVHKFFNTTSNYLHQSFGIRTRAEIIKDLIDIPIGKKMIDIGCGNGGVTLQFVESNKVTFLDLSENMIELVKGSINNDARENADFLVGSFLDLKLPHDYDYVFAIGLLAHVPSVPDSFERISQLVKPGGKAIIQFSNYNHWLTRLNIFNSAKYDYRINKLRYRELESMINRYGLVRQVEVRFSFMLPGMGKLPDKLLYRYSKLIWKNRFFAHLGTDYIWVLSKQ